MNRGRQFQNIRKFLTNNKLKEINKLLNHGSGKEEKP
jgi:hypothetical protein